MTFPAKCPHSTQTTSPETCSQCVAANQDLKVRVVARDDATGKVTVDGVAIERAFALGPSDRARQYYAKGARASGRAKKKR